MRDQLAGRRKVLARPRLEPVPRALRIALPDPGPEKPTGAEADDSLQRLEAGALRVVPRIEEAEEARASAMVSHQYSAAVAAIKEKGVLSGHRVERREIGGPGEFEHLSDDELLTALRERFARLDGELRLAISDGSITNGASRTLEDRDH